MLRETDRTTSLFFAPNPILHALRDGIVLPILRMPWVQRRMFGKLSQLHVHYRRRSLSVERGTPWRWRRIRAGEVTADDADRVNADFASLYRLGQTFICLIRPDGYVV